MNRFFSLCAFVIGAIAIISMTRAVAVGDTLTLLVMLLITSGYVAGGIELWTSQRENLRLSSVLSQAKNQNAAEEDLSAWLLRLPESLRHSVYQRLTGELTALPGLVLTPYLLGLLVMLGLMGTFVGMVATLGGAVALEGSTELSAIREGLAAPIAGLGMAFGTSVAGVAASAMLGLIATLSRRERIRAAQILDGFRANQFRSHSLPYQREQTYKMLQSQSDLLPTVVDSLATLTDRFAKLGDQLAESDRQMAEQLVCQHRDFEAGVRKDLQELTGTVVAGIHTAVAGVGAEVAQALQPQLQQWIEHTAEQQVTSLETQTSRLIDCHSTGLSEQRQDLAQSRQESEAWRGVLSQHVRDTVAALNSHQSQHLTQLSDEFAQLRELEKSAQEALVQRAESLQRAMDAHFSNLNTIEGTRSQRMQSQWDALVSGFALELASLQARFGDSFEGLSSQLEQQLSTLVSRLQESMADVVSSTAGAPRAASALIAQLKQETEQSLERRGYAERARDAHD